jgi:hypothetical protein
MQALQKLARKYCLAIPSQGGVTCDSPYTQMISPRSTFAMHPLNARDVIGPTRLRTSARNAIIVRLSEIIAESGPEHDQQIGNLTTLAHFLVSSTTRAAKSEDATMKTVAPVPGMGRHLTD